MCEYLRFLWDYDETAVLRYRSWQRHSNIDRYHHKRLVFLLLVKQHFTNFSDDKIVITQQEEDLEYTRALGEYIK